METVGKWWNGTWGRLARRDVFLRVGALWEVETREGGADGRSRIWRFTSEAEARAFIQRCLTSPGRWRDLQDPEIDGSTPPAGNTEQGSDSPHR